MDPQGTEPLDCNWLVVIEQKDRMRSHFLGDAFVLSTMKAWAMSGGVG